jgi:hypothetical protein
MTRNQSTLTELLAADPLDAGCDAGIPVFDEYVELELAGCDPAIRFPGVAAHLRSCAVCRADHDGLLHAVTQLDALPGNDPSA